MTDFTSTIHFIAHAPTVVAEMIGNPVAVDQYGDYTFSTGEFVETIPGMPDTTVLSLAPGDYDGDLHRSLQKTFGDTRAPKEVIDHLLAWLGERDLLTTRRVLAEDVNGSDAVVVDMGNDLELSLGGHLLGDGAKGVTFNAFHFEGATEIDVLPNHGTRLAVMEYPTIRADRGEFDNEEQEITPSSIEDLLQAAAIGRSRVFGILDGPLDCSQRSMYDDANDGRHVKGPGFIGQFRPHTQAASFLFMVSNENGTIVSTPCAL